MREGPGLLLSGAEIWLCIRFAAGHKSHRGAPLTKDVSVLKGCKKEPLNVTLL